MTLFVRSRMDSQLQDLQNTVMQLDRQNRHQRFEEAENEDYFDPDVNFLDFPLIQDAYPGHIYDFMCGALINCPELELVLTRYLSLIPSSLCEEMRDLPIAHILIYQSLSSIAHELDLSGSKRLPDQVEILVNFVNELATDTTVELGAIVIKHRGGMWTLEKACRDRSHGMEDELESVSTYRIFTHHLSDQAARILRLKLQQILLPSVAGQLGRKLTRLENQKAVKL